MAAYSDIGPRKKSNQDSVYGTIANTPYGETALIGVCDGVGGLSSGELASASVAYWFSQWFEKDYLQLIQTFDGNLQGLFDAVQEAWAQGLYALNDGLRNYGIANDCQLGTTCTFVLIFQGNYLFVHIGDTRIYQFGVGQMNLLTVDQTWVAREVALGNIPPEKARTHPKRNVILQSVGTQHDLQPVFGRGTYQVGDAFMVCCDGFRNELFDDELINAFGYLQSADENTIRANCEQLANLALQRGERDNISVIALSVKVPGAGPADVDSETNPTTRLNDPDDPKVSLLPQSDPDSELGRRVG